MAFRTKGGSVSAAGRRKAEAEGDTMPGGRFPIRNKADLANAKHDVGRAKNPAAARAWINRRAKELDAPKLGESKGATDGMGAGKGGMAVHSSAKSTGMHTDNSMHKERY